MTRVKDWGRMMVEAWNLRQMFFPCRPKQELHRQITCYRSAQL